MENPWSASTYHSRIYRDFRAIPEKDYHGKIRYFEKKEEEIKRLGFDEFLELTAAYTEALFQVGVYRKHALMADVVLELSIRYNIFRYKGEDLFRTTLFQKAASHYNLFEPETAEHLFSELVKLDPSDRSAAHFFRRCRQRRYPRLQNGFRAMSIFLFLMAAGLVALEILIVQPFYGIYAQLLEYSRNTLFFIGCTGMGVGYLWVRWLAERDLRLLLRAAKTKKGDLED
jgi:hypothetical protein